MTTCEIRPQFVEFIPQRLEAGVLYISERYRTASHLCPCGCGEKVVTPLSPVDWTLRNDGGLVSMHPSIGNWSYRCRSHYWIRRNQVIWAGAMTDEEIAAVQRRDLADKTRHIRQVNLQRDLAAKEAVKVNAPAGDKIVNLPTRLWRAIKKWIVR